MRGGDSGCVPAESADDVINVITWTVSVWTGIGSEVKIVTSRSWRSRGGRQGDGSVKQDQETHRSWPVPTTVRRGMRRGKVSIEQGGGDCPAWGPSRTLSFHFSRG